MATTKTLLKRIACAAMLLVFAVSSLGGTICTGHQAPHDAGAGTWLANVVANSHDSEGGRSHLDQYESAQDHDHHAVSSNDAGCDAPVYLADSATDKKDETAKRNAQIDYVSITSLRRVVPQPCELRVRYGAWSHAPPPLEDCFSVTARLRL